MNDKLVEEDCPWCKGTGVDEINGISEPCIYCEDGTIFVSADQDERLKKQEDLVCALWDFAGDLQRHTPDATRGDGAAVNLNAVAIARKRIMEIFGVKPVEIL